MSRKSTAAFATCAGIAYVLVIGTTLFRVANSAALGRQHSMEAFTAIRALYERAAGPADFETIRSEVKRVYAGNSRLARVTVYHADSGVAYALPKRSPLIEPDAEWKGYPVYRYDPQVVSRLTAQLRMPGMPGWSVDALFVTLTTEDVFVPLRDACIACAAVFLLGLLVLAVSRSDTTFSGDYLLQEEGNGRAPRTGTPDSGEEANGAPSGWPFVSNSPYESPSLVTIPLDDGYETATMSEEEFLVPEIGEPAAVTGDASVEDEYLPDLPEEEALDPPAPERLARGGDGTPDAPSSPRRDRTEDGPAIPGLEFVPNEEPHSGSGETQDGTIEVDFNAPEETARDGGPGSFANELKTPEGLFSPRSGLGWESYLKDRLGAELSRSASFEQDLTLTLFSCEPAASNDEIYHKLASLIRDFYSFRDLAFEFGKDSFAVILPNVDFNHAIRMSEEFMKKTAFMLRTRDGRVHGKFVYIGFSSRAGRLIDAGRLLTEAESALAKSRDEADTRIIGFKPNADRFREYLRNRSEE